MKSHSFILASTLLLGIACERGSSGEDGPNATGGASSGGASGGASSDASGGNSSGSTSGGAASGGSGGESSGSGGTTPADGGAGGALSPGENDPSCPEELPEHEGTCFVYPFVVCSYEDAPTPLGGHCICAALKWDCVGCPAEPIQGEMACSGYEGETCGGCSCSEASPNWDCGIEF